MKIGFVARDKEFGSFVSKKIKDYGFTLNNKNPDIILCIGGDGTFLIAERKYPGIPKVLVKHRSICRNCEKNDFHGILSRIKDKKYRTIEYAKLEAFVKGKKLIGMNDINIHYKPPFALRFNVKIGDKEFNNLIGDGIVVSTNYGSSGYFYSITKKKFKKNLGVAFNNLVSRLKYLITDKEIKVFITRGPGYVCADNNKKIININDGDIIKIKKSKDKAKLIKLTKDVKMKF